MIIWTAKSVFLIVAFAALVVAARIFRDSIKGAFSAAETEKKRLLSRRRRNLQNQKGFTLIELIAVMVIMGTLGSVAVKKVDLLTDSASAKVLATAVRELNVREKLVWANMKISYEGYAGDVEVFAALDKDIGPKLRWNPGPAIDGGTLQCESQSIVLNRTPSSSTSAGKWQ